jgi:tetratricopeptide (TPR) repeat protein
LINAKGRVVGVVTSKLGLSPHDTISTLPENVNYAIKSAYVLPLVENRNVVMVTLVGPAKKPAGVRKPDDVKNLVEVYEKSVVLVASLTLLPARDARRTVEDQPADSPAGSRVAANGAKGAAVPAAKAVSKEDAKKAQEWLKRSQQDLGKHDWAEAIRTTSAAMALDPGLDDAYANRAWAYTEKGLIEQAVADCDAALGINPGNATARNNKGLALLRAGKGEEALPFFETGCGQGLTIACENYKAVTGYDLSKKEEYLLDKSSEHFLERKWSDVVTVADQVLMINSRNHVALANRCGAESYLGALDDALADCSRAIAANPDYPLAYNNRGFVMELQGKKIQAAIDYEISCTHGLPLGCRNLERLQQE